MTRKLLSAVLSSALAVTALSTTTLLVSADAAYAAGRGNGNGNANRNNNRGRGSEQRSNNGRGAIASELKNLNAMCANGNAMANANSNSNVGRINAFYVAKADADTAFSSLPTEFQALSDDDLAAQVTALNSLIATNEATILTLQSQLGTGGDDAAINSQITALQQENLLYTQTASTIGSYLTYAAARDLALDSATGGRELSEEALAVFEAGCQR